MPYPSNSNFPTIAGYCIVENLGKGGMATVYRAVDTRCNRDVALKIITQSESVIDENVKRFKREAHTTSNLHHKNIIPIFTQGQHEQFHYISMELMQGGSLRSKLNDGLDISVGVTIIAELAEALDFLNERGLIHRDIKPDNILFRGHEDTPLISDFGIAHQPCSDLTRLTKTGKSQYVGTPHYMSPERFKGKSPDLRSELYSLGIILYELLTGTLPFHCEVYDFDVIAHMQKTQPPPPLPSKVKTFKGIINKILAKNPEKRFRSGREFAESLRNTRFELAGLTNKSIQLAAGTSSNPCIDSIVTLRNLPEAYFSRKLISNRFLCAGASALFLALAMLLPLNFISFRLEQDAMENSMAVKPTQKPQEGGARFAQANSNGIANSKDAFIDEHQMNWNTDGNVKTILNKLTHQKSTQTTAISHSAQLNIKSSPSTNAPTSVPYAHAMPNRIAEPGVPVEKKSINISVEIAPQGGKSQNLTHNQTHESAKKKAKRSSRDEVLQRLKNRVQFLENEGRNLSQLIAIHNSYSKILELDSQNNSAMISQLNIRNEIEALVRQQIISNKYGEAKQSIRILKNNDHVIAIPELEKSFASLEYEITQQASAIQNRFHTSRFISKLSNLETSFDDFQNINGKYHSPELKALIALRSKIAESYLEEIKDLIDRGEETEAETYFKSLKTRSQIYPKFAAKETLDQVENKLRQSIEAQAFIDAF